ncbi:MAG: hypothetical protein AAGA68_22365 [Pseudomonadota bacterium]
MNEFQRLLRGLGAMFLASALLGLMPRPKWTVDPALFFYGGPAAVTWAALTAFVSGLLGGFIGGKGFPVVALAVDTLIYVVIFGLLHSIAGPGDPVEMRELVARNIWPFGASLICVYIGAVVGTRFGARHPRSWSLVR